MATRIYIKRIVGADKVLANFLLFGNKMEERAKKALTDEANTILGKAMDQCPVETGDLRRSGTVDDPKVQSKSIVVEIGFHTDYAFFVHENLNARHEIGKAKYLEDPVNEAVPGLAERLAVRIRGGV